MPLPHEGHSLKVLAVDGPSGEASYPGFDVVGQPIRNHISKGALLQKLQEFFGE